MLSLGVLTTEKNAGEWTRILKITLGIALIQFFFCRTTRVCAYMLCNEFKISWYLENPEKKGCLLRFCV